MYGLFFNYKIIYNGIVVSVCVFSMVKPGQCLLNFCNCNCNCKYDKLYSTVGGKPLLEMLHKNVHCQRYIYYSGSPIKYSFNCFLKAGRVLVSRIVAGRLFQVRGPATSKARSPILDYDYSPVSAKILFLIFILELSIV